MPNLQLKMGIAVAPDLSQLRELSLFVDELANVVARHPRPFRGRGGVHAQGRPARPRRAEAGADLRAHRSGAGRQPAEHRHLRHVRPEQHPGEGGKLGFDLKKGAPEVARSSREVKHLENEGYEFEAAEGSLSLLIQKVLRHHRPMWELLEYHTHLPALRRPALCDTCEATVKLRVNDVNEYTVAEGDGPVNALDAALRKALRPFYRADRFGPARGLQGAHHRRPARARRARTRVLIVSTDGQEQLGHRRRVR